MENEEPGSLAERKTQRFNREHARIIAEQALDLGSLRDNVHDLLDLREQFLHGSRRAQPSCADEHLHHSQYRRVPGLGCRVHRFLSGGSDCVFRDRRGSVCRYGNTYLDIDARGHYFERNYRPCERVPGCQSTPAILYHHLRDGDGCLWSLGRVWGFYSCSRRSGSLSSQPGPSG